MIKRVFIVGTARSGTTLLRNLLAAHSEIISFSESKFFTVLDKYSFSGFVTPHVQKRLITFIKKQPPSHQEKINSKVPLFFREKSAVLFFKQLLDQLAHNYGANIWIEKTPEHLSVIPTIKYHLPGAVFLHIQRNSADVVASLYKRSRGKWNSPLTIDDCINRCMRDRKVEEIYTSQPAHYFVSYEELCQQTDVVLQNVCSFLGTGFEESMLHKYKKIQAEIAPHSTGKHHKIIFQPITNLNGKIFYEIFNEEEQTYILDSLKQIR
ncbi:MAG: sulfotransferase [Balneolaceae bacterium]|nr:sulfotransferase [Balneolaceae bacterium]MDR9409525.1 sulfotransferase [Balneolaceae bacterium]